MRWLLVLLVLPALAGCLSDDPPPEPAPTEPVSFGAPVPYAGTQFASHPMYGYPTAVDYTGFTGTQLPDAWMLPNGSAVPETPMGLEHVAQVDGVGAGAGIAVFGHYAFVSGNGPGHVVDIQDPMNPVKVADLDIGVRDADVIAYPDGRLVAVMASNGNIHVFDVTDPTNPALLPDLAVGSHNAAVVPGTPIVYNANSCGGSQSCIAGAEAQSGQGAGKTEIFDLTDPDNPVRLDDFQNGYGCHDITFYINAEEEKYRAYCAGIEMTQIWDITDPTNPNVIANIPVHYGVEGSPSGSVFLLLFSHLAMVNADASVLIVGDETGGGLLQGCDAYLDAQVQTASGPFGNLYFYDISDETNPVLKSFFSPTNHVTQVGDGADPRAGCTAHFGRIVEDRDLLAIAFYGAGVLLVDFSDPAHPVIVDQFNPGTNTWDVWYWQGYLFTGDLGRGMDVLKVV